MSLLVCLKINQPKTLCVVCDCAHIMCLFSRRKATAEDISRPVHVGGDLKANGDPNVSSQSQP